MAPRAKLSFVIEDELHAEPQGKYESFEAALTELRRRAAIPWDQSPNLAPCQSWATCGRHYEIIEYDQSDLPWKELRRALVLSISASEVAWAEGFTANP